MTETTMNVANADTVKTGRRHFLRGAVLGTGAVLTTGLAGCVSMPTIPNVRMPRLSGPVLRSAYRGRVDNGFTLPAVPVTKIDPKYRRQRVSYATKYEPGTIVVSTRERLLWLVEPNGTAMRYGIGVGRQGFSWGGSARIGWKRAWPTWTPPARMIGREPELARWRDGMPGGPSNPLGARALYLMRGGRDTLYRIHGSPEWWSIGTRASSGCIRLINQDIIDLYERVEPGARVVVRQG